MPTTPSSPSEVVRRFMKLMEPLDYDAALKLVTPDCEYTNPPPIGTVHGPAGIRAVLEPFFGPTTENEFRICESRRPETSCSSSASTATSSVRSGSSCR